jgi:transposase
MKAHKKPYTQEFRVQMLELIKAGRNPKELAAEFGCHVTTLRDWMKQNSVIQGAVPSTSTQLIDKERAELVQLRREVKRLKIERDILAKATAWFAKQDGEMAQ